MQTTAPLSRSIRAQLKRGFKLSLLVSPFAMIAFFTKPVWDEVVKERLHPSNGTVVERTVVLPAAHGTDILDSSEAKVSRQDVGSSLTITARSTRPVADPIDYVVSTVQEAVRITRSDPHGDASHWTFPGSFIIVRNQGEVPELNVVVDIALRDTQRLNSIACVPAQEVQLDGMVREVVASKVVGESPRVRHLLIFIPSLPIKGLAAIRLSFEDEMLVSDDPSVTVQSSVVAGVRTSPDRVPDFAQLVGRFN